MNKKQKIVPCVAGAIIIFMVFIVQPQHENGETDYGMNFIITVVVTIIGFLSFHFLKTRKNKKISADSE